MGTDPETGQFVISLAMTQKSVIVNRVHYGVGIYTNGRPEEITKSMEKDCVTGALTPRHDFDD